jgi:hypothetical protein
VLGLFRTQQNEAIKTPEKGQILGYKTSPIFSIFLITIPCVPGRYAGAMLFAQIFRAFLARGGPCTLASPGGGQRATNTKVMPFPKKVKHASSFAYRNDLEQSTTHLYFTVFVFLKLWRHLVEIPCDYATLYTTKCEREPHSRPLLLLNGSLVD